MKQPLLFDQLVLNLSSDRFRKLLEGNEKRCFMILRCIISWFALTMKLNILWVSQFVSSTS